MNHLLTIVKPYGMNINMEKMPAMNKILVICRVICKATAVKKTLFAFIIMIKKICLML